MVKADSGAKASDTMMLVASLAALAIVARGVLQKGTKQVNTGKRADEKLEQEICERLAENNQIY